MADITEYARLAQDSGAFRDIELDILKDSLRASIERPRAPYVSVELRDGRLLAGFGLVSRTPNTEFTFDVAALCVDPAYVGKGIGRRLVELLEEEVLGQADSGILRFETSTRKRAAAGPELLEDCGYSLIGHIADFYEKGDDYFIFARHLFRQRGAHAERNDAETAEALK